MFPAAVQVQGLASVSFLYINLSYKCALQIGLNTVRHDQKLLNYNLKNNRSPTKKCSDFMDGTQ